jgi:hypothetical protein
LILRGLNGKQAEKNEIDRYASNEMNQHELLCSKSTTNTASCRTILEKRKANGAVAELDQPLVILPLPTTSIAAEGEVIAAQVPKSGRDIRDLDRE